MRQVERLKKPLGNGAIGTNGEIIQQLSLSWLNLRNNLTHSKVQVHHEGQTGPGGPSRKPLCPSLSNRHSIPQFGIAGSFNCLDSGLSFPKHCAPFLLLFFLFVPGSPYSSGLRRGAMLKYHLLQNQHENQTQRDPSRYHTLSTNTTACFTRLPSSGKLFLISAFRTVFSSTAWTSSPLSVHSHPSGGGNVNTRQLPSTQHHRIASHATVLLHLTTWATSPSQRPVLRPPHLYI